MAEEKDKILVFHKNCDDGFGAAFAGWKAQGEQFDFLAMDFHDKLDIEKLRGKEVIVADFSFSPDIVFNQILPISKSLTILDHHRSSMDLWHEFGNNSLESDILYKYEKDNLSVFFDMNKSGALLAWEHFFKDTGSDIPKLIEHISDGDLFRFSNHLTKPFQMYLRSRDRSFSEWDNIHSYMSQPSEAARIYQHGEVVKDYQERQVTGQATSRAVKEVMLRVSPPGQKSYIAKGLIKNASLSYATDLGNRLAIKCGTFAIIWETDGEKCYCSIRSIGDFNCIPLAKQYGGGGHRRACGFSMPISEMLAILNKERI